MSAQPTTPTPRRRPRGRLLVVGSSHEIREFASIARKHIDAVSESPNLFEAIADIGIAGDREPIAAVAILAGADGYASEDALRAIESADKSVAVVLLYPRGDEQSAAAIADGFEDTIPLPATAEDLIEVFLPLGLTDPPRTKHADGSELDIETFRRNDSARVVDSMIARARANAHAHPESPLEAEFKLPEQKVSDDHKVSRPTERAPDNTGDNTRDHVLKNAGSTPQRTPDLSREAPMATPRPAVRATPSSNNPAIASATTSASGAGKTTGASHAAPTSNSSQPSSSAPSPANQLSASPIDPTRVDEVIALKDRALLRALRDRTSVREVALVLIRHALKTQDVRLATPPRPGEETAIARDRVDVHEAPVLGARTHHGILLSRTIDAARLASWAIWLAEWLDFEESHLELHRLATVDELTGALNRRAFANLLPTIIERARAERRRVSLMYFDIDDFKLYNDRYGHAAGDEVLRESIAALRDSIRAGDLVFRMGGDEFVVLFCDPNPPRRGGSGVPENVEEIAERCRAAVRRLQLPLLADSGPGPVTISAGCALFPWDAANADELIALADKRALEAKRLGKDQINFGPDRSSEHFSG